MLRCSLRLNSSFARLIRRELSVDESLRILDLDRNASKKDIKNAYLRKVKIYHPDNQSTGDDLKFRQLATAQTVLEKFKQTGQTGPTSTEEKSNNANQARHQARYEQYTKAHNLKKERDKQGAAALLMAVVLVVILLSLTWTSQSKNIREVAKIEMLNMAKKHNVPVWVIFTEYREYYVARHGKSSLKRGMQGFQPQTMSWDDIWVLDQHFSNLHPLVVQHLLFYQTPERLRPKN